MQLENYKLAIESTWNKQTNQNVHVHLLIKSEIGELESAYKKLYGYGRPLDIDNIIEELGDLMYGLFTWSRLNGINAIIPDLFTTDPNVESISEDNVCDNMDSLTMGVMILVKTDVITYENIWKSIFQILNKVREITELSWEEIMDANIKKLSKRYPDLAFNSEHSAIRLDKIGHDEE